MRTMLYFLTKAALSGILIALISEVAKSRPGVGALIASLPLISILAIIWLWRDTGDTVRIASHMTATFWYVIPSLPMFLTVPLLLRGGMNFWLSLGAGVLLTIVLYAVTAMIAAKFGVKL